MTNNMSSKKRKHRLGKSQRFQDLLQILDLEAQFKYCFQATVMIAPSHLKVYLVYLAQLNLQVTPASAVTLTAATWRTTQLSPVNTHKHKR